MAIQLVANAYASATQTTAAIDTTGADLIVAWYASSTDITVTDSKSNTWTDLTLIGNGVDLIYSRVRYCLNPTVGSGHTFTNGVSYASIAVAAFSGVSVASEAASTAGSGSGTSLATGSVVPVEDNELLVAFLGLAADTSSSGNTADSASGFSLITSLDSTTGVTYGAALSYQVQTSKTTRNHTWTWTGSSIRTAALVSFKSSAPAAPSAVIPRRAMKIWSYER